MIQKNFFLIYTWHRSQNDFRRRFHNGIMFIVFLNDSLSRHISFCMWIRTDRWVWLMALAGRTNCSKSWCGLLKTLTPAESGSRGDKALTENITLEAQGALVKSCRCLFHTCVRCNYIGAQHQLATVHLSSARLDWSGQPDSEKEREGGNTGWDGRGRQEFISYLTWFNLSLTWVLSLY